MSQIKLWLKFYGSHQCFSAGQHWATSANSDCPAVWSHQWRGLAKSAFFIHISLMIICSRCGLEFPDLTCLRSLRSLVEASGGWKRDWNLMWRISTPVTSSTSFSPWTPARGIMTFIAAKKILLALPFFTLLEFLSYQAGCWQCSQPRPFLDRPNALLPGKNARQPQPEYVWVSRSDQVNSSLKTNLAHFTVAKTQAKPAKGRRRSYATNGSTAGSAKAKPQRRLHGPSLLGQEPSG